MNTGVIASTAREYTRVYRHLQYIRLVRVRVQHHVTLHGSLSQVACSNHRGEMLMIFVWFIGFGLAC
jgi:hypothetical protein